MADIPLLKSPVPVAEIDATGTPDATTYLRGDGSWQEPPGGGGVTFTTLGKDAVGASWETWTQHRYFMKKITLASAGMLGAVEAHVKLSTADQVRSILFGLWADNAGSPRELLSYTDARSLSALWSGPAGSTNARWASGAMGRYLAAGSYWIGVGSNDTASGGHLQLAYDGSGADRYFTSGGAWNADAGFYTVTTGTRDYSIRATVLS